MRKFIICLIGAIILSNCEIRPKQAHAQSSGNSGNITVDHYTIDGMDYAVFTYLTQARGSSELAGGISVVNVTRDKLQCEIIKTNLKKLKDGNN